MLFKQPMSVPCFLPTPLGVELGDGLSVSGPRRSLARPFGHGNLARIARPVRLVGFGELLDGTRGKWQSCLGSDGLKRGTIRHGKPAWKLEMKGRMGSRTC